MQRANRLREIPLAAETRFAVDPLDEAVKIAGAIPTFIAATCSMRSAPAIFRNGNCRCSCSPKRKQKIPVRSSRFDQIDTGRISAAASYRRMVLTAGRTISCAETEQVAFCPSHVVPHRFLERSMYCKGVCSRIWTRSYPAWLVELSPDTLNAPQCPFANHQRGPVICKWRNQPDMGILRTEYPGSGFPTRRQPGTYFIARRADGGERHKGRIRCGELCRQTATARQFYRSQNAFDRRAILCRRFGL